MSPSEPRQPPDGGRLSPLDGSFLRTDSPRAHMHVGWSAVFATAPDRDRPTLQALRDRVAARADDIPWCRWKLQSAPLGLLEPRWVRDRDFDPAAHVVAIAADDECVSYHTFARLRDAILSEPLDRSRPLWQMFLIPRLEDGRVGLIGKIHHALVDGMAALQIVGLILDTAPDAGSKDRTRTAASSAGGSGPPAPRVNSWSRPVADVRAVLKATAAAATRPDAPARAALQVLAAARDDLLPLAPGSFLNVPISTSRTLVGYRATRQDLRAARSTGVALNDIGLTMVAGAVRSLAIRRGEEPHAALKAMVPVSTRSLSDTGPGNRISMITIQLPVHVSSALERLESVRGQMMALKGSNRAANMQTLYEAGGLVPAPLRSPVAHAMASPRVFNLTVSQSPGPRGAIHMLGCELQEVYSVVPIPDGHALAIGMIRYRHELYIGCYADPEALPEVHQLPALLETELRALGAPSALRPARLEADEEGGTLHSLV
jgi:diacylglycerol O-acyltransferase